MTLHFSASLKPSFWGLGLLLLMHSCAWLAMVLLLLQHVQPGAGLYLLLLASSFVVVLFRHYFLLWRGTYQHLQVHAQRQLSLTQALNIQQFPELLALELLRTSYVHRYLIVLHLPHQPGRPRYFVLFPDMLSEDDWLHLQVCLRHQLAR